MTKRSPFRYFKTSPEVIRLAVMMYVRFPLSLRNVEDLLHERGVDVSHETIRFWWNRFGPMFASEIARKRREQARSHSNWQWHLDEVFVKINGKRVDIPSYRVRKGEVIELSDGLQLDIAGLKLSFHHTPGHTPGSIVAVVESQLLLSGDVLFAGSIGRTDLPLGSLSDMERSLREKIIPLPDHLRVLPGHGKTSTIGAERERNPYLRAAMEGRLG